MRPTWNEYFMKIASEVAQRSTCLRRKVGAVLVRDNCKLATGYNGAPRGIQHCEERGCLRAELKIPSGERHEICRGAHAESNALVQAAVHGVSIEGATLYCTNHPCAFCAKMLINAGVKLLIIDEGYPDELAGNLLCEAGVVVRVFWVDDSKEKEMSQQVQTEKSGKDQLFEMLRRQKLVAEDKLKAEWSNKASVVMIVLRGWLGPAIDEGLFTVKEHKAGYQPALYLTTPNGRAVDFESYVILGVSMYDDELGRILISSGPNRAILILKKTGEWKIRLLDGSREKAQDLTEEIFIQVISSMIQ